TNPFLETSVSPVQPPSDTSMRSFLVPEEGSLGRFLTAVKLLRRRLMNDCLDDTPASNTLKKRSYLVTRNVDGSLDLTDVVYEYLETVTGGDVILRCRVTSRTEKLL